MKLHQRATINLITLSVLIPLLFTACDDKNNTRPTPMFTISPSYGNVETVFSFDASEVRDAEDPVENLQVRWDWESDSIFDTEFSTEKTATHKFAVGGTYYITVEVKDTKGLTARATDYVRVAYNNRPPTASFTVIPESGYLQDIFIFDASSSSDPEDNNADLKLRWDFNGDGTWDTEYSKDKTGEHQYAVSGDYMVKLEVVDSEGLTDQAEYKLTVAGTNTAPEKPEAVAPSVNNNSVSTRCLLEWSCTDPENDELVFDVYFGTSQNPPLIASGVKIFTYLCLPLNFSTDYYWKIVAKDPYGHEVAGDVWAFTTWNPDYEMATVRDPRDGKIYKTVTIDGKIWMAENLNIGTMIHASTGGDNNDGYMKNNDKTEKFCYQNNTDNCDLYGGLYQWEEARRYQDTDVSNSVEGICMPGWHLPTVTEWNELQLFFEEDLGISAGENLMWGGKSGFEMLFAGYLIFAERKFYDMRQAGYVWSANKNPGTGLGHLAMGRSVFNGKSDFQEDTFGQLNGLPVRCLKDY